MKPTLRNGGTCSRSLESKDGEGVLSDQENGPDTTRKIMVTFIYTVSSIAIHVLSFYSTIFNQARLSCKTTMAAKKVYKCHKNQANPICRYDVVVNDVSCGRVNKLPYGLGIGTPLKTNMSPEKRQGPKRKLVC